MLSISCFHQGPSLSETETEDAIIEGVEVVWPNGKGKYYLSDIWQASSLCLISHLSQGEIIPTLSFPHKCIDNKYKDNWRNLKIKCKWVVLGTFKEL